jgi:hypothetical protein
MDDVELDFKIVGVKNGEQELWTQQNGHLSWGKPRLNLKVCSIEEEDEEEEEEEKISMMN